MIHGVQAGAEGVVLGAHAGATAQSLLDLTSVFLREKSGFVSLRGSLAGEYGFIKGNK